MPNIVILVGPPGSGKSTLAKSLIENDGDRGAATVYINQDSQGKAHLDHFQAALDARQDIVVDRMGFSRDQRNRYIFPASGRGYTHKIIVLHQPYKVCLERVLARQDHETIKDEKSARAALATFFGKYQRPEKGEANEIEFRYPEGYKPSAIICDLDGTLCNVDHRLHFVRHEEGVKKDWKNFFANIPGDSVNGWCETILHSMARIGHQIVYCSGRPDDHRRNTVDWLYEKGLYLINRTNNSSPSDRFPAPLYMRPRNDSRDDSIVKEIILDFEILTRFTPYFMIDDRKRVFEMWRRRGFTCLACANGDF